MSAETITIGNSEFEIPEDIDIEYMARVLEPVVDSTARLDVLVEDLLPRLLNPETQGEVRFGINYGRIRGFVESLYPDLVIGIANKDTRILAGVASKLLSKNLDDSYCIPLGESVLIHSSRVANLAFLSATELENPGSIDPEKYAQSVVLSVSNILDRLHGYL